MNLFTEAINNSHLGSAQILVMSPCCDLDKTDKQQKQAPLHAAIRQGMYGKHAYCLCLVFNQL